MNYFIAFFLILVIFLWVGEAGLFKENTYCTQNLKVFLWGYKRKNGPKILPTLTLQLYSDLLMGALGLNVLDRLTMLRVEVRGRPAFPPINGFWMNTHSVLVSLSTLSRAGNTKLAYNRDMVRNYFY